ncbi:extracellular solute-binding protein [Bosea sp. NBC_00550]|uniref:extracellular solute-binding protein n=1 Tax=Bosea sp. NBC_00550 TaxID=2969621 RepID=UPI0022317243|nr:extracellular solute-binding protein [Bosea sp. NBC_00550]UZF94951.1 extracellular solute-binding protein [Bosea sp. NBC_00550]
MLDLNRRKLIRGLGAGAVGLATGGLRIGGAHAQSQAITVTAFGGIWEQTIRDVMVPDFTKRTGVRANVLIGGPQQWMAQIEANRAKPPIDVLMNTVDLALIAGKTGLVEPMAKDKVPNLADVPARFLDVVEGNGVLFTYGAWGLAYHERVKQPPKSFKEFVEGTIKGRWRASLPSAAYTGTPQILIWSLADALGGSVDNVTPAFEAIKQMKANSVFWTGISDPLTQLESGEADVAVYVDGRAWAHFDAGAKWIRYVNPTEGGVMQPSIAQKVKNGSDAAWEYINSLLSPGPQAEVAKRMNFGVSNSKVDYPEPLGSRITPWQETRWPPFEKTGIAQREWLDRWNREIRA